MYKCLVLALPGNGVRIEPITLGSDPKLSNGRERLDPYITGDHKRSWNWSDKMVIFSVICVVFTKEEFLNSSLVDTTSEWKKPQNAIF